ncbi:MAG: hypothetical protein ABUL62_13030 [Myxococcales bacterium]|jgi:hypothetical protein
MQWFVPPSFVLFSLFAGCGGGSPPASSPTSSTHAVGSNEPSQDDSAADDAPAEEEAPKAGACDDGTCSPCGSGICPAGWYCDESAAGGPACGWLPACAQKSSCGCVTAKLGSSCKCSEQSGGLHVTCK